MSANRSSASAGRQWPALLFCPALSVIVTLSILYHIPHRPALGLEFDENRQWALTGSMWRGIVGASHR